VTDRPAPGTPPAGDPGPVPGLGEQVGRTRNAFLGLIGAHVDLAKAELGEIFGNVGAAIAKGCAASALLMIAGGLLSIGGVLFLGELIFGSIGWGVLDGSLLLICVAALLVLGMIELSAARAGTSLLVAFGAGLVVFAVLVIDWGGIVRSNPGLPPAWLLGLLVGGLIIGLLGLVLGASYGKWGATGGFVAGFIFGLLIGLLGSAGPGARVAAALGIAVLLLFWPIVAAVMVFRTGIDRDKLRARFVPDQTIETTKETIEWVREQMPLGRKS
jgi:hypothetical protein